MLASNNRQTPVYLATNEETLNANAIIQKFVRYKLATFVYKIA